MHAVPDKVVEPLVDCMLVVDTGVVAGTGVAVDIGAVVDIAVVAHTGTVVDIGVVVDTEVAADIAIGMVVDIPDMVAGKVVHNPDSHSLHNGLRMKLLDRVHKIR